MAHRFLISSGTTLAGFNLHGCIGIDWPSPGTFQPWNLPRYDPSLHGSEFWIIIPKCRQLRVTV